MWYSSYVILILPFNIFGSNGQIPWAFGLNLWWTVYYFILYNEYLSLWTAQCKLGDEGSCVSMNKVMPWLDYPLAYNQ